MRITLVQPYITSAVGREFYNIQSFGLSKELVKHVSEVTILTSNLVWQSADRGFIAKTEAAKEFLVSQGVKSNKITVVPVGFVREKYCEANGDMLRKLTKINIKNCAGVPKEKLCGVILDTKVKWFLGHKRRQSYA